MLTTALQPLPPIHCMKLALVLCIIRMSSWFFKNSCPVPVVFGSSKWSVTRFIARCWQGVCVYTALGWPEDSSVCHGVASLCIPLYYVLLGLRQTSLRSVTHKSTITRFGVSRLVFSGELEILCSHVRVKSLKLGCWPCGRSEKCNKFLGRWRRRGQVACEHGNMISNLDKGVTAGLS